MEIQPAADEEKLLVCLVLQSEHYSRALGLLEQISERFAEKQDVEELLHAVDVELNQVARIEQEFAAAKATWRSQRCSPGRELKQQMDHVQALLEKLLTQVADAEQRAEVARSRMRPQVESEVQGARMRSAYARFSNIRPAAPAP